jgi:hypothetical protein
MPLEQVDELDDPLVLLQRDRDLIGVGVLGEQAGVNTDR